MRRSFRFTTIASLCVALAAPAYAEIGEAPPKVTAPTVIVKVGGGIKWGKCQDEGLIEAKAQCGFLKVPLNWQKPNGRKISLAVSRVRHTTKRSQGIMLVNPGGPGGSGLTLSTLGQFVPDDVGQSYDWIGFDPRGVGDSKPALSCWNNYFQGPRPSYVANTPALMKVWRKRSRTYAIKCGKSKASRLLDHVTTRDTVRDMEALRRALGEQKINFYGFSYGTYLGQVYATLYPSRVRRMVLDSSVNPNRVWYQANLDQNVAFDKNMDIYFGWLADHDSTYHLGATQAVVKQGYYDKLRQLTQAPLGEFGPDELTDSMLGAGYYNFGWVDTAEHYAALINDDNPAPLLADYENGNPTGPGGDNGYAIYAATQCTDARWPQKWSTWKRDARRLHASHPFFTWDNTWYNAPCFWWPGKLRKPVKVNGHKAPPILLIGETKDAATPFTGSLEVRRRFPRSVLVAGIGGTTHAASLYGVACVDDTIAAYLKNGKLPKRKGGNAVWDKGCEALAPPEPGQKPRSRSTATSPWLELTGGLR